MQKAISDCLDAKADVPAAFSRGDIGIIDLKYGDSKKGMAHIVSRRDAYAKSQPGAMNGKELISHLPEVLVRGAVKEDSSKGGHTMKTIELGAFRAILTKDHESSGNHWLLSAYDVSDEGRGYRKERGGK